MPPHWVTPLNLIWSKMKESSFWRSFKKGLTSTGTNLFIQRHEDRCTPGIPDVSILYCGKTTWLELKYLKRWPRNLHTNVKIKHFTAAQKCWLKHYSKCGGNAWLLLRVYKDVFIIHPQILQEEKDLTYYHLNFAKPGWNYTGIHRFETYHSFVTDFLG